MTDDAKLEIERGSGNVFRDVNHAEADVHHAKAKLAARIIAELDEQDLSTRAASGKTGYDASDFARIRSADLSRFTLDRLIKILIALDEEAEVSVSVRPRVDPQSEDVQPTAS